MKRRLNPVVVGAFVLGGLLLGAAALLTFGAGRWFSEPYRFVVMINDSSVSGLDVGSAVKLRGVRIGRVESVTARYDRASEQIAVRVVCDFDDTAANELLDGIADSSATLMRELILDGLHAKLNFSGITGLLYMDLLIRKEEGDNTPGEVEYETETGYPIVPMAPSLLAEFTDSISAITTGLASVDYAGISSQLHAVLENLNHALASVDLKKTSGQVEAAAGALADLAGNPRIEEAFVTLNQSLHDLRALLAAWREATPGLRADVATAVDAATSALAEVERTAGAATNLLQARRDLPDELAGTLTRLQRAADAIERLADYLERNPSALLRGRPDGTTESK